MTQFDKVFRRLMLLVLAALPAVAGAQDTKAAKILMQNTTSATGVESSYKSQAKAINDDKKDIMTDYTMRYTLRMLDKQSRERKVFDRNSLVYRELVRECTLFAKEFAEMVSLMYKNPANNYAFLKGGYDILYEAQAAVKHCIVIGMNGKVPNPWTVSYDKLIGGKEYAPNYESDPNRDRDAEDQYNLLLPDERYRLVNRTIDKIHNLRDAMRKVTWRLRSDFKLRNVFMTVAPYDYSIALSLQTAYEDLSKDIRNFPNPF